MLKTEEIRVTRQTSDHHPAESTADTPSHTDVLYMPPVKRCRLQGTLTDVLISQYQRLAWTDFKKIVKRKVKEANKVDIPEIARELFKTNIIRGRGLLANAIIKAQIKSSSKTSVYAALVSIINSKFPQIGELICKRLILSFHQTYQRHDKIICLATTKFLAHLINQRVLHGIIAFQILLVLLENLTDDSVELAGGLLKECGQKLLQDSRQELDCTFSVLRNLLDESSLNKDTKDMIGDLFIIRRDEFDAYPAIQFGLDLVEKNDQYIHILKLNDSYDAETMLDQFKYDEEYEDNENKYKQIRKRILDKNSDVEDESSSNSSDSDKEDDTNEEKQKERIINQTETNLVRLHHKICLIIETSIEAEQCAHKLLKINLRHRQKDLCRMIVDICAEQSTYEYFFGLLGERLCLLKKIYAFWFQCIFQDFYGIAYRLEIFKLMNVAKFFAHLLVTDSISWQVFGSICLTEKNTTPLSRIYLKNIFLELFELLGFIKLKNRLTDSTSRHFFKGFFLRDNPENARFCINFFTSIGFTRITDELCVNYNNSSSFVTLNPTTPSWSHIIDKLLNGLGNSNSTNVLTSVSSNNLTSTYLPYSNHLTPSLSMQINYQETDYQMIEEQLQRNSADNSNAFEHNQTYLYHQDTSLTPFNII